MTVQSGDFGLSGPTGAYEDRVYGAEPGRDDVIEARNRLISGEIAKFVASLRASLEAWDRGRRVEFLSYENTLGADGNYAGRWVAATDRDVCGAIEDAVFDFGFGDFDYADMED